MKGEFNMATETQVSKKYRVLTDAANDKWDRVSFWTKAADVENTAGSNLQSTVGAIKGITTSLSTTQTGYALDASVASKISGGTDITKAEWDALPDSAKNTGTYYITDYDVEPVQQQIDTINQNLTNCIPFPDYAKVITQGNINTSNNSMSSVDYTEYTAIEDCILCIHFTLIGTSKHGHVALVNNSIVYGRESDVAVAANCETECVLWLKKGDVAKMKALSNSNNSFYRVHGLR